MTGEPRRAIALIADRCTSCLLCAKECPTWCIDLDAHKEVTQLPGARPRTDLVLDRFRIDLGLCMFCGICVEVCPFDALVWSDQPVLAGSRDEACITWSAAESSSSP